MVEEQATANRWVGRPGLARTVRAAVYVVPFVFSVVGAFVLSQVIPPAPNVALAVLRVFAITAGATVVMRVVDSLTRRALPLATLFDLTLVFPDQAPSRFKVALRGGASNVDLKQQLETYQKMGADEPAAAAEQLLELVGALSRHDRLTRGHSERVRAYAQMIGKEMGLSGDDLDKLRWAGLIHDIGKLKIDPAILNKPGKLTAEEYEIIKTHPDLGAELARPLAGWLGPSVRAVSEHHEKWDGTGYPRGLRGTDISLAARIVAVADVFDVMTSVRSYKAARPASEARAELARCAGTHFDPAVVRAFMSLSLGRLRLAMGPLSWFTQLSLFPQQLLASASAGSGVVTSTVATGASVASSAGAGASAAALTVAAASTGMAAGGPLMSHQYDTYQAPQAVPAAVVPAESQPAAPGDPIVIMTPTTTSTATVTTVLGGASLGVGSSGVVLGSSGAPAATLPQSAAAPGAPAAVGPTTTSTTSPELAAPLPAQQQSGDDDAEAAPAAAAPPTTTGRRPSPTTTTPPKTPATTTPRTTTPPTTPRTTTPPTTPRTTTPPTTTPRTTTTTAPKKNAPPATTAAPTTTTKKNWPTTTTAAPTTTTKKNTPTTTTTAAPAPTAPPTVAPTLPAVVVSTPAADAAVQPGAIVTVPAPATTVAPTPSMTGTWLLTSSAPGDVASTAVLGFAQRDPLNATVVNLDTDRNSAPGRTIVKGGWTYFGSTSKVQRFAYDPGTAFNVNGRIQLDLWAAPADGTDRKIKIVAVLAKCDDAGIVCLPVKDAGESFRGDAGTFELVSLDFGTRAVSVGQSERLELWVFASDNSDSDLVVSYDTVGTASALRIS